MTLTRSPAGTTRIALIGDRDDTVVAHRAIPQALQRAAEDCTLALAWDWLHTASLAPAVEAGLEEYTGIWCVPASPYADTEAALSAIRFARERGVPFLGTCGGFQHAILEYARNVLRARGAAHAELEPDAHDPLIAPLACSLVEERGTVLLEADTRLGRAYGATRVEEGYHCRYGLAPGWEDRLVAAGLRVSGRDPHGDVRGMELPEHTFFVITLFQPERAALDGITPPAVRAFAAAAASSRAQRTNS